MRLALLYHGGWCAYQGRNQRTSLCVQFLDEAAKHSAHQDAVFLASPIASATDACCIRFCCRVLRRFQR
jgi:hypothetical protein